MKFFLIFLVSCFLFSCSDATELLINYDSFPDSERQLFAGIFENNSLKGFGFVLVKDPGPRTIVITFERRRTNWEKAEDLSNTAETKHNDNFFLFSRICFVYSAEVWEDKKITVSNVSYDDLIPLYDLAPPYIACKIEGLDISSPRYPFVYETGIRFSCEEMQKKTLDRKISAFTQYIQKRISLMENSAENFPAENFRREQRPKIYRIAAGGDVMLARGVEGILLSEGPEGVLGGTSVLVKEADLTLINLEGVVSDRGEAAGKTYIFRFDPKIAPVLKNAGFTAVLIANNHAFDYGMTGFFDTLDHLKNAGIGILGAGRDIYASAEPFVTGSAAFPVNVFGIASYGRERSGWDGLNYASDEQTPGILHAGKRGVELIKQQLDKNSFNIILFHGGIEYADYPDDNTRAIYTDLVRSGADLVIGTHPHVEQGFEWVDKKPVFWSLGDYVFDEMDDTPGGDMGLFIVLSYAGRQLVHIDLYPVFMAGPRTVISPQKQLDRFYRLTKNLALTK